jgi:peptidoglycan-associated lipoprotein
MTISMKSIQTGSVALALALLLAACSSPVKLDQPAPIENRGAGNAGNATNRANPGTDPNASKREVATVTVNADPSTDANNPLSKRSIYFDFDSFEIRSEFKPVLEAHAKYLLSNKGRRVVIGGNTDDRGSREYNLALGQKRSEAVRRALSALGVPETQLEAVSFGEEKPKAAGSDETAWAENRRADLDYPK